MRLVKENSTESKSISSIEALDIIERIKSERPVKNNHTLESIEEYLKELPGLGEVSWATRTRKSLMEAGMTDYEASLIINLSPERHTDAKALIPSLSRFDNYTLDMLLNEMVGIQN
ncbi:hypothetical protein NEOKW01_0109 [Nematocida sp. AWRm80]|nr:hypothetical protein NEOKW01_0109 [Nematocida sp. AWRm80]